MWVFHRSSLCRHFFKLYSKWVFNLNILHGNLVWVLDAYFFSDRMFLQFSSTVPSILISMRVIYVAILCGLSMWMFYVGIN